MPRLMLVAPTQEDTLQFVTNYVKGIDPSAVVVVSDELPLETCTQCIETFGTIAESDHEAAE